MATDETQGLPGGLGGLAGKLGGALSGVFGEGSIAQQFLIWGVLQQVAQAVLAPAMTELQQSVYSVAPDLVNSPNVLADLVVRGLLSDGSGKNNAAKFGIGGESFEELVDGAGHAPPLSEVIALMQRGKVGRGAANGKDVSIDGALTDAGIRAEWHDLLAGLSVQIPSIAEVMNAWLEGQIEEGEASTRYLAAGGDPTWFQTSYNANGQAPTPVQALEMLNRGLIGDSGTGPDSTSYEQAFLEGPWRNKWLPAFRGLANYIPPPRTVTAMHKEGALTDAEATQYLKDAGINGTLAAAYLMASTSAKTATAKELSKTDVLKLYSESLISPAQALPFLEALGYSATEAGYLLKLQDVSRAAANLTSAVSRVRSLFIAGKLDATAATASLTALGVPADQSAPLIAAWTIEHQASAPRLGVATITAAAYYQIMTDAEAQTRLEAMGYTSEDAYILISVRAHGAATDITA